MTSQEQKNQEQEQYILALNKKIEFAEGLKLLEENKGFQELISKLEKELERGKEIMLRCKKEELENAREFPRGIAAVLRQIELWKKEGIRAKEKLNNLTKNNKK